MRSPHNTRGSCPRCNGREVQHYIYGLPDIDTFADAEGNVPVWIHFAGCLMSQGASFDRSCDTCGLQWRD